MKERGLSMSALMIRSYLAGLKGQTRRLINPQPPEGAMPDAIITFNRVPTAWGWDCQPCIKCPYGVPGDELYFREHWRAATALDKLSPKELKVGCPIQYEAGGTNEGPFLKLPCSLGKFRQGRFMCRWMSRFRHIPITGIRVERLGDISEQDAIDEGIEPMEIATIKGWKNYLFETAYPPHKSEITDHQHRIVGYTDPRASFQSLWTSIHGPHSWERDRGKWVWIIVFPKREVKK